MARIVHRQIEELAAAIRAEAEWWLQRGANGKTNAQLVAERANADTDDALAGIDYAAVRRGGAELTPLEQRMERALAAKNYRDEVTERIHRLNGLVREAKLNLRDARRIGGQLITTIDSEDLKEVHRVASISTTAARGYCENCGRWCEGTRDDRRVKPTTSQANRAGAIYQCDTCLRYWSRNLQLRPPKLWAAEDIVAVGS